MFLMILHLIRRGAGVQFSGTRGSCECIYYRFKSADVRQYLDDNFNEHRNEFNNRGPRQPQRFDRLERVHEVFMKGG